MHAAATSTTQDPSSDVQGENTDSHAFSRNEVFKRIEEDRERHKRLRERRWVQPIVHRPQSVPILASFAPLPVDNVPPEEPPFSTDLNAIEKEAPTPPGPTSNPATKSSNTARRTSVPDLPIDIEFDNAWETTSDWNEDDDEAVAEENALCYPNAAIRFDLGPGDGQLALGSTKAVFSSGSAPPPGSTSGHFAAPQFRPAGPQSSSAPSSSPQQAKRRMRIDRKRLDKFTDRRGD